MRRVVEAQGALEFRALAGRVRLRKGQAHPRFELLVREHNPAHQAHLLLLETLHGVQNAVAHALLFRLAAAQQLDAGPEEHGP
eukprot:5428136-Alexandrium_andersonii.AAC.1